MKNATVDIVRYNLMPVKKNKMLRQIQRKVKSDLTIKIRHFAKLICKTDHQIRFVGIVLMRRCFAMSNYPQGRTKTTNVGNNNSREARSCCYLK